MARIRWIVFCLFFSAASYAVVGSYTWHKHHIEIFPIYSWDLFSFIPNDVYDFNLRLTSINDKSLPESLYFNQAIDHIPEANSITAFHTIQTFGFQFVDGIDSAETQNQIHQLYFSSLDTVTYELVWRQYRPLDFRRDGTFILEEVKEFFVYSADGQ